MQGRHRVYTRVRDGVCGVGALAALTRGRRSVSTQDAHALAFACPSALGVRALELLDRRRAVATRVRSPRSDRRLTATRASQGRRRIGGACLSPRVAAPRFVLRYALLKRSYEREQHTAKELVVISELEVRGVRDDACIVGELQLGCRSPAMRATPRRSTAAVAAFRACILRRDRIVDRIGGSNRLTA